MKSKATFRKLDLGKITSAISEEASSPGQIRYVGRAAGDAPATVTVTNYGPDFLETVTLDNPKKELPKHLKSKGISWINVAGVSDTEIVSLVGELFKIHPLVLEDVANTTQRPKMDEFENYIFTVLRKFNLDQGQQDSAIQSEQVSIIFGENFVVTFQEGRDDIFHPLRERLKKTGGRLRTLGSDYLAFAICDSIVDHYFSLIENLGERIEKAEDELLDKPSESLQAEIYCIKRRLVYIRRAVWPTRETMGYLMRSDHRLVTPDVRTYFRDVYDHTIQINETLESLRDIIFGMMDLYLSIVSNKMNEIMKVLTIFAAIFIPLTFIAGVYGMNFEHIPELAWEWSYAIFWGAIFFIVVGMLVYFKRKRWL